MDLTRALIDTQNGLLVDQALEDERGYGNS